MSEMDKQIIETIVQLMRDGGAYATYGLVAWFCYQLIRLSLIGGIAWMLIKCVSSLILAIINRCKEISETKISLISDDISEDLVKSIDQMASATKDSLKSVEIELKKLQEQSKTG